ncbi:MAG: L,D-transpeptidase family protein [Gaiellaceae bacterium]
MRRAGFILCLVAVCALGAGATAVSADTTPTTIADGVTIGTVAVGGLTGQEATAAVKGAYYAPLVLRVGHHTVTVRTNHFHVLADVTTAVQTALTAAADTAVPLTPTLDASLIQKWVVALAGKTAIAPIAGTVRLRNDRPRLTHAHPGRALQKLATRSLIRDAILAGDRTTIVAPLRKLNAPAPKSQPVIVIRRGINRLLLYNGTHYVRSFPVATGQAIYPTPLGHFQIVVKELNPWWYPPTQDAWAKGLKPVPPGPGNPLGTRWMGLSAPGVGIHGTDEPWSIGHSESHGCIRMQVPNAEWLYTRVRVGTPVFIVSH